MSLDEIRKEMQQKRNQLSYILNRDDRIKKSKARQKITQRIPWSQRADNKSKVLICPFDLYVMDYVSGNQNSKKYQCRICKTVWICKKEMPN